MRTAAAGGRSLHASHSQGAWPPKGGGRRAPWKMSKMGLGPAPPCYGLEIMQTPALKDGLGYLPPWSRTEMEWPPKQSVRNSLLFSPLL